MELKLKYSRDKLLIFAIMINVAYNSWTTFLYSFIGYTSQARFLLITVLLVVDFFVIMKCLDKVIVFIGIFGFLSALMLSTYILFPANQWIVKELSFDAMKYVILSFFLAITPFEKLEIGLKRGAYFILITSSFELITKYVTSGYGGYMVYGMRVLTAAIILGYFYVKERKKIHLAAWIMALLLILLYGNRSALVIAILSQVIQHLILSDIKNKTIKIIGLVFCCFLGIGVVLGGFINPLIDCLENMGISSRTLSILSDGLGSLMDNNGRTILWGNSWKAILDNPLIGYGIGGERNLPIFGERYFEVVGSIYAHNIFLEIMIDFGMVLGGILILLLLAGSVCIILDKRENVCRNLFTVIFVATLIKLSFSSSFWSDISFYLCLGIALNYYLTKKKRMQRGGVNKCLTMHK